MSASRGSSRRINAAAGPFIAINCGSNPDTFSRASCWSRRGAHRGDEPSPCLFEAAHGGTLLLDEVCEVSPGIQIKLLRALQEREIRRVGDNKNRTSTCIVAATNRDLALGVIPGNFRRISLRLKVVELRVPALRDSQKTIFCRALVLLAEAAFE